MTLTLFLVAGEPSGDRLGAALMKGLKSLVPDVEFHGVGGPLMGAEGLETLFPMEELSVMGLAEVLPKLRHLFALKHQAAEAAIALKPDALITIDSPDFCLRVAKEVREAAPDIPTIHYVAPSVWAWRPKRATKMGSSIDHVLALLPFEPPYMQAAGMSCDFVGHPVVAEPLASQAEADAFRARHGVEDDETLLLVLPGSRRSEVSKLAHTFGAAAGKLAQKHKVKAVIPTVPHVADLTREAVAGWPVETIFLDPRELEASAYKAEKAAAFRAANIALAASGTVSLELAASDTPMVIAYDMNRISLAIMTAMAKIDTVTLVNLISETRVVTDYIGKNCNPDSIAEGLDGLISDPEMRAVQHSAMTLTMDRLGRGGDAPGLLAARSVLAKLGVTPDAP